MKQYDIITHHTIVVLKNEVNSKIHEGWEAHGDLVVFYDPEKKIFILCNQ